MTDLATLLPEARQAISQTGQFIREMVAGEGLDHHTAHLGG